MPFLPKFGLRAPHAPQSLLVNKLCKTKAEASGASLESAELEALLKAVLYAGAREPNKQAALAADSAFIYLLRVASSRARGSEASPEVRYSCHAL